MTPLEQMKATAKIENAAMIRNNNGRSSNFGVKIPNQNGGRPRLSDIKRSKGAQELLHLSQQGLTQEHAARTLGLSRAQTRRKARRYQITFSGDDE